MPNRAFFDLVVDDRTYHVTQLAPPLDAGDVTWMVSHAGRYVCSVRYGSSLLLTRQQLEAALVSEVRRAAGNRDAQGGAPFP